MVIWGDGGRRDEAGGCGGGWIMMDMDGWGWGMMGGLGWDVAQRTPRAAAPGARGPPRYRCRGPRAAMGHGTGTGTRSHGPRGGMGRVDPAGAILGSGWLRPRPRRGTPGITRLWGWRGDPSSRRRTHQLGVDSRTLCVRGDACDLAYDRKLVARPCGPARAPPPAARVCVRVLACVRLSACPVACLPARPSAHLPVFPPAR